MEARPLLFLDMVTNINYNGGKQVDYQYNKVGDLVKNYTGHDYDSVLSQYYAKTRMYDAGDRRFTAVDPVKGSLNNPLTLVQYIYVVNNPLIYIDFLGTSDDRGSGRTGPAIIASWHNPKNDPAQVMDIQKKFKTLGYYHGNTDGTYVDLTREAVRDFQDEHVPVNLRSGIVDEDTLKFINNSYESKVRREKVTSTASGMGFKSIEEHAENGEEWANWESILIESNRYW